MCAYLKRHAIDIEFVICIAGVTNSGMLALPLLPYKLLYAYKLAEYGHLTQAMQYLGIVRASLGSMGNKMPTALLVCSGMAADLEGRLRAHAAVSSLHPHAPRMPACRALFQLSLRMHAETHYRCHRHLHQ